MDGCFCVYVVNTTDALLLFFKQRNLEIKAPVRGAESLCHQAAHTWAVTPSPAVCPMAPCAGAHPDGQRARR